MRVRISVRLFAARCPWRLFKSFFFQAEDGIRDIGVTGVQTCALPISANRRVMYNRASADLKGNPWSERKRWVWWDPNFVNPPDPKTGKPVPHGKWVGYDTPDFAATKAPDAQPKPDGIALDALSGAQPFIMRADGRGWLFVPAGLVEGPVPT